MRNAFARELTLLAGEDPRVVLLSGDIGNRLFDPFKERFPDRFYNCGVAEANMIGTAAGLAACGLRPVAYTIAQFLTTRCLEQIRVDLCYHELPVVLAGVGAGLSYASLGATHHCCEDIALLRAMPRMTVVCSGDPAEVRLALRTALRCRGPVYLRLGKKGEPAVHPKPPSFRLGKGIRVRKGRDVCLLSTGNILPVVLDAARRLEAKNVSAEVVSCHTVKPLDAALLSRAFRDFGWVVTVEEHSVIGGFGGAVAEWLADQPTPRGRLLRIGTPDAFPHEAGGQNYLRSRFGLTPEDIARRVLRALATGPRGKGGRR